MPRAPHRTLLRVGSRHTVSSGSENGATPTKELRRRAPKLARRRGSIVVEASARLGSDHPRYAFAVSVQEEGEAIPRQVGRVGYPDSV